jgi:chromosome segregation ATPase
MPVSPRLPKHLRTALGGEAGEELVTILDEIRNDFARLETRLDERFSRIDERFAGVERRFDQIDQRFQRLESKVDSLDGRLVALDIKLGDVKADLMKWSFVFWCGAVASVAALAGVLN